MSTARLFALYRLGSEYHSGQWSQGYRILCRASTALRRRGITDPFRLGPDRWPQSFRNDFAAELRRFRRFRFTI